MKRYTCEGPCEMELPWTKFATYASGYRCRLCTDCTALANAVRREVRAQGKRYGEGAVVQIAATKEFPGVDIDAIYRLPRYRHLRAAP